MIERDAVISIEQMRAIARYELTFDRIFKALGTENVRLIFPDKYRITLEDLYIALQNIVKEDPTVGDFGEHWYYPLTNLEEVFCIPEACGVGPDDEACEGDDSAEDGYELLMNLFLRENEMFSRIWHGLEDIWTEEDDANHIGGSEEIKQYIQETELFFSNRGKPIEEMEFTDRQKEIFIATFGIDEYVKAASEQALNLCRKFTEELCAKDSVPALHIKGYACYGGNRLYDCNWQASRDCMIRLFEITDDPEYANTLGYIYYYGRCTGSVPEYEKAFNMFTISAANGLHEGLYKLADMFLHGYACKKSEKTARTLYRMVYDDCYKQFLEGLDGAFADAALRMGNVYSKGIGGPKDPERAYRYYLQADFAAKLRAEYSEFFGDTDVILGIRRSLDETGAELPEDFFEECVKTDRPRIFQELAEQGYRVRTTVKSSEDGKTFVSLSRIPRRGEESPDNIMLTLPSIGYCNLVTGIEMEAFGLRSSFGDSAELSFKYDSCEWNDVEKRIDFYYDEDFIGWIACDEYRFYNPKKTQPGGQLLKLVGIAFQPNERIFDYLCDIPDVAVGDKVIVTGYDGETEVEVLQVYTKYETELGLPLDRYKRVIRKAD